MSPICITGMHRSGTSMVARIARTLGVWLGDDTDLVKAAPDNPDGFFEHGVLVAATETLFEHLGGGWDCPPTLEPGWHTSSAAACARDEAIPALTELAAHGLWGWKDPRAASVLEFWTDLVPGLRVVACVRNPLEVAASLRARNGTSLELGVRLWHRHMAAVLSVAPTARLLTHYDAWFHQPDIEIARLTDYIGIDPTPEVLHAALGVPAGHARHARFDARSVRTAGLDSSVRDLYERLCEEAGWPDGYDSPVASNSIPHRSHADPPVAPATDADADADVDLASDATTGRVRRDIVDVGVARHEIHKRNGRIAQLDRRIVELEQALAASKMSSSNTATPRSSSNADFGHEQLRSGLYDVQQAIDELAVRLRNGIDHEANERDLAYVRMIRSVRAAVRQHIPVDADIVVLSENEAALLDLHGRPSRHFPVTESGDEPGPHPPTASAAVAHLLSVQATGATHLIVPPTANWWLSAYPAFAERLEIGATLLDASADRATIYQLSTRTEPTRWISAALALTAAGRRIGDTPMVLDLTSAGLATANSFRPLDEFNASAYADSSVDVVAVDAGARAELVEEASRVASTGVLSASPDGWTWVWSAPPKPVQVDVILVAPNNSVATSYGEYFLDSLPLGLVGQLTVVCPAAAHELWTAQLSGHAGVVAVATMVDLGPTLRSIAAQSGQQAIAVVDGSALPLDGWLPLLVEAIDSNDRIGLATARRRDRAGTPIVASSTLHQSGLLPVHGAEADCLLSRIEVAGPGACVTRRSLLATSEAMLSPLSTISYALAAYCAELTVDGHDIVVVPESEVVDLGHRRDSAFDVARDLALLSAQLQPVSP